LVFVTTYRPGVLNADMPRSCEHARRKVRGGVGVEPRELNGQDDHVRLLAGYPPKVAVPALVNGLKPVPARPLRSQFTGRVSQHITHGHFWSPS
jgi:putative transposase